MARPGIKLLSEGGSLLQRGESRRRRTRKRSGNKTSALRLDPFDADHDRFEYRYLGPKGLPARGSDRNSSPRPTTSEPLGDFEQSCDLEDVEMSAKVAGCEFELPLEVAEQHRAALRGDRQYRESESLMHQLLECSSRVRQPGDRSTSERQVIPFGTGSS